MRQYARRLARLIGEIEDVQNRYARELERDKADGGWLSEAKKALYAVVQAGDK